MPKRSSRLLLEDILTAIGKIQRYIANMDRVGFLADEKTVDAVVRNLEIIGEASRQLPEGFKSQHPDIPWNKMAGLRNRIVHDYIGIDQEIVWHIIQNELVALRSAIESLL
jgi:uncharacterized protein with HEPN domain